MSSFATKSSPVKMPDGINDYTTTVLYHPLAVIDNLSDPRYLKYLEVIDTAPIALPTDDRTPRLGQPGYTITTIQNAYHDDGTLDPQLQTPSYTLDSATQLMKHLSLHQQAHISGYAAARPVRRQSPGFTIFDKLPTELKNRIWIEAAKNEPRNIYAIEVPAYRNGGVILDSEGNVPNPSDSTWTIHISGTTIPNVLISCKSAHDAVMKIGIYKPMFQMKGSTRAYYINPEIDRIHLGSNLPAYGLVPCGTLSDYLANPREAVMIRRAALPLNLFEDESYWCIFSIESLFDLKELQLIGHIRSPAQTTPFKLVLDFESHDIPFLVNPTTSDQIAYRTEARPVYGGYTYMNAMLESFQYIAEESEHGRLMDVWPLVTQAFELVPHLEKLTLCVKYTS